MRDTAPNVFRLLSRWKCFWHLYNWNFKVFDEFCGQSDLWLDQFFNENKLITFHWHRERAINTCLRKNTFNIALERSFNFSNKINAGGGKLSPILHSIELGIDFNCLFEWNWPHISLSFHARISVCQHFGHQHKMTRLIDTSDEFYRCIEIMKAVSKVALNLWSSIAISSYRRRCGIQAPSA